MKQPRRRCVVCRCCCGKEELIRLVLDDAGRIWSDEHQRRPGRGVYVHKQAACLSQAGQVGKLAHSFRVEKGRLDIAHWQTVLAELLCRHVVQLGEPESAGQETRVKVRLRLR